uniref:Uncharacterized protein n=1 Tax=viral metagenome TaxID=1070528 RepID=A0A6M3K2Z0_9ZZZZ
MTTLEKWEVLFRDAKDDFSQNTFWIIPVVAFLMALTLVVVFICQARAETIKYVSYPQIADAIFLAEGGHKARFLYGIKSISYKNEADARQICINSVRNNVIRWYKAGKPGDFFEFMRNRYCPLSDAKINRFWLKNVKYYLVRVK